jgi:hypothetical protein
LPAKPDKEPHHVRGATLGFPSREHYDSGCPRPVREEHRMRVIVEYCVV